MLGEIFSNILLYSVPPTATIAGYLLYKVDQNRCTTACEISDMKEQMAAQLKTIQYWEKQYADKLKENNQLFSKWTDAKAGHINERVQLTGCLNRTNNDLLAIADSLDMQTLKLSKSLRATATANKMTVMRIENDH